MTAQQIIDEAKIDFPDETDTRALSDLQSVWDQLCIRYKLIWSREDVSLTAGTKEYALPASSVRVYSAIYQTAATTGTVLEATHTDYLDKYDERWRLQSSGTPRKFYVDIANGVVGFHPTPDTTTSTYPKVVVDVSKTQSLLVGTTLGGNLPSYQVCVEGLKARMALRTEDSRYQVFSQMFRQEIILLDRILTGAADFQPHVRSNQPSLSRRRRA